MLMLREVHAIPCTGPLEELRTFALRSADEKPSARLDVKRVIDVVGAAIALMLFAPVMLTIFIVLACTGGRPFFVQTRVGRDGSLFHCYKFRSMVVNAHKVLLTHLENDPAAREEWTRTFKLAKDPRVTWFGNFLRRSSLDELPQILNILRGEMSLVGPRPIVPDEVPYYADKIRAYFRCKPGLTGLWQVSGRNLVTYRGRVRLDAFYARKRSIALDGLILYRTASAVLTGHGAC